MIAVQQTPVVMKEVSDATELAEAQSQHQQFVRNAAWLQNHASEINAQHRGKCICIAGDVLFVACGASEMTDLSDR